MAMRKEKTGGQRRRGFEERRRRKTVAEEGLREEPRHERERIGVWKWCGHGCETRWERKDMKRPEEMAIGRARGWEELGFVCLVRCGEESGFYGLYS